ncbi:DUF748 domain-containing protein [Maribacter polysiphoniae]|uniref:DUF748 domain-containing protein n=1 Tax=Maribacter polysiphoniae TaxID=429344 RepID=A0A316E6I2_9FLAO|nr:DUF748 domain-containing protein [Maribacter polysiphoniae]MBD1260542.1 DUF748 domain-containing protein [Maribacter polysiphoniae]PWK24333.1 uncharacterized protein DUF748 [Maribacter polysiphoniae]
MKKYLKISKIKSTKARSFHVLIMFTGLCIILIWGLQIYASYKIPELINERIPKNMEVDFEEMDLNILLGTIRFQSINYKYFNKESNELEVEVTIGALDINGLAYWPLWKDAKFKCDRVRVQNVGISKLNKTSGEVGFSIDNGNMEMSGFKTDATLFHRKIPFTYQRIRFGINGLFLNLSPFESLTAESINHKDHNLEIVDLEIFSKYSRDELSRKLNKERDHMVLSIPKGLVNDLCLKTLNDSLYFSVRKVDVLKPELTMYRDKLLKDDKVVKPLFGAQLQRLPMKLDIQDIAIKDGSVSYSEQVNEDVEPVSITFNRLVANINKLSNTTDLQTKVEAKALLMNEAPIQLLWDFNSSGHDDYFNASAILKNLNAEEINPFLESQAKVRAEGHINEMYLTIHGNGFKSHGNMKMKYNDFKFSMLDEDRLGIDKTLTLIVNLITNDGSKTDEMGYRYGKVEVERDRSKSFFNYLWLNLRDGLKNTVVGNGKK